MLNAIQHDDVVHDDVVHDDVVHDEQCMMSGALSIEAFGGKHKLGVDAYALRYELCE